MSAHDLALPINTVPAEKDDQPDAAWPLLDHWLRHETELAFVYARSGGGLLETGNARLTHLASAALTLEGHGCKLMVVLGGASYEHGPQLFFTNDFSGRFQVEGVEIRLANHDWLFLSASPIPRQLAVGPLAIGLA